MIEVVGISFKGWWLALGTPIVAFLAASMVGFLLSIIVVGYCAICRRRWLHGERGRDLIAPHLFGGPHER